MTAVKKALAMRQLDSMFGNMSVDREGRRSPLVSCTIEHDPNCDVHGRCSTPYRSSLYLHSRESTPSFGRDVASPTGGLIVRRRDSTRVSASPARELEHPSTFPSLLRRDRYSPSATPPRRDTPSPTHRCNTKRHSLGSFPNLSRTNVVNYRRDSTVSNGVRDMKRDYVGSTNSLSRKSSKDTIGSATALSRKCSRDYPDSINSLSRKSSIDTKKSSTDSLDIWHTSWDTGRKNNSVSSVAHDARLPFGHQKNNSGHQAMASAGPSSQPAAEDIKQQFKPVLLLEDLQAIRCAEFHPNGKLFAIGSNTKTIRICSYPRMEDFNETTPAVPPTVLVKRTKHHKGSIYCLAWSPAGDLIATGSNDKTVKMMRFDPQSCNLEGQEVELQMHDGTVRDICFIVDSTNKASVLVSGGAGDCKIYVTDCATSNTYQSLSGHSGNVMCLYNWGGAVFVSGSQDKTIRFWDLRTGDCVNVITPLTGLPSKGVAVTSVAVEPTGRLLVGGHDDGSCTLYDVRRSRSVQCFTPHTGDVLSVRFSPGAYYLLTASYDGRVMLTDMQGDLTYALPSVLAARHPDKVISARWHPDHFTFLTTSADKTAALWSIPSP